MHRTSALLWTSDVQPRPTANPAIRQRSQKPSLIELSQRGPGFTCQRRMKPSEQLLVVPLNSPHLTLRIDLNCDARTVQHTSVDHRKKVREISEQQRRGIGRPEASDPGGGAPG